MTTPDVNLLSPIVINVGLAEHHGDWNWQNVSSPFARIYCVTYGKAQIRMGNNTYDLTPGNLYFVPAFTRHSYICDSDFTHYYIHIYEEHPDPTCQLEDWDIPFSVVAHEYDELLMERLCLINPSMGLPQSNPKSYDNQENVRRNLSVQSKRNFSEKMESRGIVYQILSRFFTSAHPKKRTNDVRIEQAIDYIRQNIFLPLKTENLASMVCLSKDHFIRLFKKETGVTPTQYITNKKMEKAQLLLATENISIYDITVKLSYTDVAYFDRVFRNTIGMSPLAYRQMHRTLGAE
jgi:AraC-like DNA-binding protein